MILDSLAEYSHPITKTFTVLMWENILMKNDPVEANLQAVQNMCVQCSYALHNDISVSDKLHA
jgi:hypothetical protein